MADRWSDRPGGSRNNVRLRVLRGSIALHRLPILRQGLRRVRNPSRPLDDQLRFHRSLGDHRHARLTSVGIATILPARRFAPPTRSRRAKTASCMSALKPRCIACSNCVLACPFGIPKIVPEYEQMMKCDMCYDRTSAGKRPDVRHRLSEPGARLRAARKTSRRGARNPPMSSISEIRRSRRRST